MDIFGLIVLILTALVAVVIQSGLALGVMYAMHKYLPDKFPEHDYRTFNFDRFEKKDFTEMATHLVMVFLIPTVLFHAILFVLFDRFPGLKLYTAAICCVLFLLETGVIAAGFHFFFSLDRLRIIYLTTASAVIYLLVLWLALYSKLY